MAINLYRVENSYRCEFCKFSNRECFQCRKITRTTKYVDDEIYVINEPSELGKIPSGVKLIFFNNEPNEINWKSLKDLPPSIETMDLGFNNLIYPGISKEYNSPNVSVQGMNKYIQLLYDVFLSLPKLKLIILSHKYSLITFSHIDEVCRIMKRKIFIEQILY